MSNFVLQTNNKICHFGNQFFCEYDIRHDEINKHCLQKLEKLRNKFCKTIYKIIFLFIINLQYNLYNQPTLSNPKVTRNRSTSFQSCLNQSYDMSTLIFRIDIFEKLDQ